MTLMKDTSLRKNVGKIRKGPHNLLFFIMKVYKSLQVVVETSSPLFITPGNFHSFSSMHTPTS